jgi:YhcG PDDEXK nuclease domain
MDKEKSPEERYEDRLTLKEGDWEIVEKKKTPEAGAPTKFDESGKHAVAVGQLRAAYAAFKTSGMYDRHVGSRDQTLARFQPIFSVDHIPTISADEFKSFLLVENNRHWSGLHRQGTRMCSDMTKLRRGLATLLAEDQPLAQRLDSAIDDVFGMGKNVASAILLVAHPDKYGVWNNRSEARMRQLEFWPSFERGDPFGERYVKVNQVLLWLRDALDIDLWTLDALWWFLDQSDPSAEDEEEKLVLAVNEGSTTPAGATQRFGLERHLHQFLRDNWGQIELSKDWAIYSEKGDEERGYEYPCDVGRIDLLAKHKREGRWLVIELKREQSTDQTVGQLLRYIGWVRHHLAGKDEPVHGMIICREADKALQYALHAVSNVELQLYEVEFRLKPTPALLDPRKLGN